MRNTRSTRTVASAGSSGALTVALPAIAMLESPGMSNRRALPVAWAMLMPVRIVPDVVSNATAAVPAFGRPAVSLDGNVSFTNRQISLETAPRFTAAPALAWPGTPCMSMNATVALSKYPPSFELHPSEIANRKHCCWWPRYMRSESGIPPARDVLSGTPLSAKPSRSVKHCGSGLNTMKPGNCSWPQHSAPFGWMPGYVCPPKIHVSPEKNRLNMPAYMSYQSTMSSLALRIVAEMPIELATPPGPGTRLIVGETTCCEISRNAVNRESPAFSPSSWLPTVITSPPMLQIRAGEFGGPHRSLYVSAESGSTWMYSPGGLPVERQLLTEFTPGGPGSRLSIEPTPLCSAPSKLPRTTGPPPVSIVTSSICTAPRPAEV